MTDKLVVDCGSLRDRWRVWEWFIEDATFAGYDLDGRMVWEESRRKPVEGQLLDFVRMKAWFVAL